MIRLIVSSSQPVTEDWCEVFCQTFEVENKELEIFLKSHKASVVGSEIIEPPKEE